MSKYRCFNIVWDTDGEALDLPTELTVELDADADPSLEGADALSDAVGFCVHSFDFEKE